MSAFRYPSWQEPVFLAAMESDPKKVQEKVTTALQAIRRRRKELQDIPDNRVEGAALDDALSTLNELKLVLRNSSGG
jgi:hypothetical protein